MAQLSIYYQADPLATEPAYVSRDPEAIRARLAEIDVHYERLDLPPVHLESDAHQDEVIESYREDLDTLMQRHGFVAVDVLCITESHPRLKQLREEFTNEHWHRNHEGRLFVDGRGLFYIREDNAIYALLCERGDFVYLPAGVSHWFDMGERPAFRSIRLFSDPEGWGGAVLTGSDMAGHFPPLERQLGER
jgi:1,2-dihydroxy-3-keto-5-methylthiopentene dioxygenase